MWSLPWAVGAGVSPLSFVQNFSFGADFGLSFSSFPERIWQVLQGLESFGTKSPSAVCTVVNPVPQVKTEPLEGSETQWRSQLGERRVHLINLVSDWMLYSLQVCQSLFSARPLFTPSNGLPLHLKRKKNPPLSVSRKWIGVSDIYTSVCSRNMRSKQELGHLQP